MVKVDEIPENQADHDISSDSETDGDMPEQAGDKQSRSEKKSKKAMMKIGMKVVPGVFRVVAKRGRNHLIVFQSPEVLRSANAETYVVLGAHKMEDLGAQHQASSAKRFTQTPEVSKVGHAVVAKRVEEAEEGEIDESGLEPKDIDLVMSQVGCSRRKAVIALKQADGDIVEAIMQLSA